MEEGDMHSARQPGGGSLGQSRSERSRAQLEMSLSRILGVYKSPQVGLWGGKRSAGRAVRWVLT